MDPKTPKDIEGITIKRREVPKITFKDRVQNPLFILSVLLLLYGVYNAGRIWSWW
jgi:uncharacterized membrane protein YiaA